MGCPEICSQAAVRLSQLSNRRWNGAKRFGAALHHPSVCLLAAPFEIFNRTNVVLALASLFVSYLNIWKIN
jgi:hypothetical protein